ncbi:TadE/TadG family type IV pilus assembly protein, partial [Klebsiella pneumoniae]|uniref:TadE/TadG family type IV pilus assembly protein n=1 Tax=Klebsiella pneumoniae TaxID=573 RepID=UPI003854320F
LRRLARESDANVMILTALAALPTLFGLGFSIDYARAMMLQARINAVADAASLAGTDTIYLLKDVPTTTAAATQIFTAQVAE